MLKAADIGKIVDQISRKFDPKQVILFGSYAYGSPTPDSDLDLLIIDDHRNNKQQLAIDISQYLFPRNYGLDVVVTSPEEIQEKQIKGLTFWTEILNRGKKLYER